MLDIFYKLLACALLFVGALTIHEAVNYLGTLSGGFIILAGMLAVTSK